MQQEGYSIIIPVKELNRYVREGLIEILDLDYQNYEVIIIPNSLGNPAELDPVFNHPRVRILESGRVSPAVKRDQGAEAAAYSRLAFLDDDAYPRQDWLKVADRMFIESGAAAVCGPGVTPAQNGVRQQASGLFYETYVGGGGLDYRYRPRGKGFYVEDFPTVNLIVDRQAFFDVGGFDCNYWPGEDTKFCHDFVVAGFKIWYCGELLVWHHRRQVFWPHLLQVANYGLHRGHFAKRFPRTSLLLVYWVPSLFLLTHLALLIGGYFFPDAKTMWYWLVGLYLTMVVVDIGLRTRRPLLLLLTSLTVVFSHFAYGAMFLRGLFKRNAPRSSLR